MSEKTVGAGGDYSDLSAWEYAIQNEPSGTHTAKLISDFSDNTIINTWPSNTTLVIKSDVPGTNRKITSESTKSHVISVDDVDITSITIQDLTLDGSGQAAYKSALRISNGANILALFERVMFTNATHHNVLISSGMDGTGITFNNCIFENGGTSAIRHLKVDVSNTTNFNNCLFVGNSSSQVYQSNANQTLNFNNCLAFGNTGAGFAHAGTNCVTNLDSCVSDDTSAELGTHDSTSNCQAGVTDPSSASPAYFTNYDEGDYSLAQSDVDSWGIQGNVAKTPATDFTNTTRENHSIGQYEFIVAPSSSSSSSPVYTSFIYVGNGRSATQRQENSSEGQFQGSVKTIQAMSTYDSDFKHDTIVRN